MTAGPHALEKAEKYYSRLIAGKSLEKRVSLAISDYAVSRNDNPDRTKISTALYLPEIDINGIDFILRIESRTFVHLLEVQIKTTRNGLQISDSLFEMARKYTKLGSAFLVVCCRDPESLADLHNAKCFHSWDIEELCEHGRHIAGAIIDTLPALDETLETLIAAMT